jgi:hypothetical protein
MEAITAINIIKLRKLRFTVSYSGPIHFKAPGLRMYVSIKKLIGTVIDKTKITAKPRPTAVLTVLETARYEHIPKKYAKIIFSMKILFMNRFKYASIN